VKGITAPPRRGGWGRMMYWPKYRSVIDLGDGYYFVEVEDNVYKLHGNYVEKLIGFIIKYEGVE